MGEEGSNCLLKAAVVVSNMFNLDVSNVALQRTWFKKEVYSRVMGANVRRLVENHKEAIATNPNIDLDRLRATTYLHEFDREIQLPSWG